MRYSTDIWTAAVCVFEHWELIVHCMRTEELERARAREREHFYQRDSAYPAFINFKLFNNELWLPGKNGTSGHHVPNPSGAEAIVSDR